MIAKLRNGKRFEGADVLVKGLCFQQEVLNFERGLIRSVLAEVNGSVTYAAALMGISYQRLAHIIEKRHPDLLNERSRGGWEPALMTQDAQRITVVFRRDADAELGGGSA